MGKARVLLFPTPAIRKQVGQLKKLFGLWGNKRGKGCAQRELNPPIDAMKDGVPNFLSQTRGLRNTHITRRQIVLNRHFTEIISDVLAQGFQQELDEQGVSITSIETRTWNKGICVFYTTKGAYDEEQQRRLNKLVPDILSAITERRLIGRTPRVNFVHDKSIQTDEILSEALSNVHIEVKEETQVTETGANQLYVSKNLGSFEQKLISKRFMAPTDMDNKMFGLDYPMLYDEVALRLSRGRGEASRMQTNINTLTKAKPLFQAPKDNNDELDPMARLLRMKKFIISQRQKNENLARTRRKAEIYARNSVKWQIVDDADQLVDKNEATAQGSTQDYLVDDLHR